MKVTEGVLIYYKQETLTMLNDIIGIVERYFSFDTFDIEVGDFVARYEHLYYHKNPDFIIFFIEDNTDFIISKLGFFKCIIMFNSIVDGNLHEYFGDWGLSNRNNVIDYINDIKKQVISEFDILVDVSELV